MISIKNLEVTLKSTIINYDDFDFKSKKITFITGKNGSGKTTLLKSIAGLQSYKGSITNSNVTYVSSTPVMFNMSVLDNILYPLIIRKQNSEEYLDKIKEYCKLLELTDLLSSNAKTLSAGEKMKTSIIRAIIFNPDFVLLDEPTTSLDIDSIKELTHLLKQLKQNIGFIIVSHDRLFQEDLMDESLELGGHNVQR